MTFSLFGLTVYGYGLAVAVAAAVSLAVAGGFLRRAGLRPETLSWFALLAVPLGVLGARGAYCLACWNWFAQEGWQFFFQLTRGGFMLYGALAGGFLAAFLSAKITRQPMARLTDALAAPALLMIALCRLAEGLAGQGYGCPVEDWFSPYMGMSLFHPESVEAFCFFPLAVQESYYQQWVFAVFVLEALVMLALFVAVARIKTHRPGWRAMLMLFLYACVQVLCEALRRDDVLRWGFVRINQVVGGVIAAVCLAVCCVSQPPAVRQLKSMVLSWVGILAGAGLVLACEFAVEKKIVALEWVPTDVVYVFTTLGCLIMILSTWKQWKRSDTV